MESLHLIPAYGRDYKNKAQVLEDWNAGKDFKLATTGQYCSKRDAENTEVWIRYAKMTKIIKAQ